MQGNDIDRLARSVISREIVRKRGVTRSKARFK